MNAQSEQQQKLQRTTSLIIDFGVAAFLTAMGLLVGAGIGWLEWSVQAFTPFALMAMALAAAGLAYFLGRRIILSPRWFGLMMGIALGLGLLIGNYVAQYIAFDRDWREQLVEDFAERGQPTDPEFINAFVETTLRQATGTTGLIGYTIKNIQDSGADFIIPWLLRIALVLAVAILTAIEAQRAARNTVPPS